MSDNINIAVTEVVEEVAVVVTEPESQVDVEILEGQYTSWGDITGTLSDQADLQAALNAKQNALAYTPENVANKLTAFQVTPDDTHYVSEKLVKDSLDGKSATGHNHNLNDLAEKSYNSLTDKPVISNGAAPATFVPANPTGTSQSSYRMMGLGATLKMTPLKSGKIRFTINGKNTGTQAGLEINIKVSYGTGVAPVNGVAAAGFVVGGTYNNGIVGTAGGCTSTFMKDVIVTGLSVGTEYWFDLQICRGSVSGTVQVSNLEATFEELPY